VSAVPFDRPDPRVDCACGRHVFRAVEREWYTLTSDGPKVFKTVLSCMKGRGPEAEFPTITEAVGRLVKRLR